MVAKQHHEILSLSYSLNLAKIHMVAKLTVAMIGSEIRLNLAKIHMVAKPFTIFLL